MIVKVCGLLVSIHLVGECLWFHQQEFTQHSHYRHILSGCWHIIKTTVIWHSLISLQSCKKNYISMYIGIPLQFFQKHLLFSIVVFSLISFKITNYSSRTWKSAHLDAFIWKHTTFFRYTCIYSSSDRKIWSPNIRAFLSASQL